MIFLSASIPDQNRDQKYHSTADVVAIRDSIRALATIVIPKSYLVWGGHPAITPLIWYVMSTMGKNAQQHITLYQSNFFQKYFPKDNRFFEKIVVTEAGGDRNASLQIMRIRMLTEHHYKAGIFIGGMEGVEEEYAMFKEFHPQAPVFPIASTGAAARIVFDSEPNLDVRLLNEYAYMALFRSLFDGIIEF